MFLHLGSNYMIRKDKIIAIMDLETINNSQVSRSFLNNRVNSGKVHHIADEGKEKSFILSDSECYFSPISSSTLLKRSMNGMEFDSL